MFVVRTTGDIYAAVFLLLFLGLPLIGLVDEHVWVESIVLEFLIVASFVLTFLRCSSPILSYFKGLSFVAAHWRTGIILLTVLVSLPILLLLHALATVIALCSFALGKKWAQRAFLRACHLLSRRHLHLDQALAALARHSSR